MAEFSERPVIFECRTNTLIGILHHAAAGRTQSVGLVIVVGGPQYRIGSHRQFLLLARAVASAGFSVFRFDLRGMGDSTGSQIDFKNSGPDIEAAIEAFLEAEPGLDGVVLWGLCDAASSILMEGAGHPMVRGLVLLNPWVRSDDTVASARINHYYGKRFFSRVFWRKLLSGNVALRKSLVGFLADWRTRNDFKRRGDRANSDLLSSTDSAADFREKMLRGIRQFESPVLVILSGADLTAGEFVELTKGHAGWREALGKPGVTTLRLEDADHTFSTARWRHIIEEWTVERMMLLDSTIAQHPGFMVEPGHLAR